METAEIRRRFLSFYESKGHTVVPSRRSSTTTPTCCSSTPAWCRSSPTSSGSRPRRGTAPRRCRSASAPVTSRRSARPRRHGTFFQMNGNFSFGDYFKEGAIRFAWELITTPQGQGGYGLDADKIWPTVYEDDDEALDLWHKTDRHPRGADHPPRASSTTTGTWASPAPVARAARSTSTAAPSTAARAARPSTRTATSSSGTSSSCSTSCRPCAPRTTSTSPASCRRRTSTPAWAWSGWRPCCRASTTSTRSTRSTRSSTGRPS